eukprot:TRINITY_DN17224_c0_g1_i1.p1 TRINITY_DN17224_c0_g1~~TRINITY_DN17224_c0_g1_i1.p1  ORF type:complete len:930 (+),score=223.46 TRINITY_DN17224_c0_g1_i1:84-2873(+)
MAHRSAPASGSPRNAALHADAAEAAGRRSEKRLSITPAITSQSAAHSAALRGGATAAAAAASLCVAAVADEAAAPDELGEVRCTDLTALERALGQMMLTTPEPPRPARSRPRRKKDPRRACQTAAPSAALAPNGAPFNAADYVPRSSVTVPVRDFRRQPGALAELPAARMAQLARHGAIHLPAPVAPPPPRAPIVRAVHPPPPRRGPLPPRPPLRSLLPGGEPDGRSPRADPDGAYDGGDEARVTVAQHIAARNEWTHHLTGLLQRKLREHWHRVHGPTPRPCSEAREARLAAETTAAAKASVLTDEQREVLGIAFAISMADTRISALSSALESDRRSVRIARIAAMEEKRAGRAARRAQCVEVAAAGAAAVVAVGAVRPQEPDPPADSGPQVSVVLEAASDAKSGTPSTGLFPIARQETTLAARQLAHLTPSAETPASDLRSSGTTALLREVLGDNFQKQQSTAERSSDAGPQTERSEAGGQAEGSQHAAPAPEASHHEGRSGAGSRPPSRGSNSRPGSRAPSRGSLRSEPRVKTPEESSEPGTPAISSPSSWTSDESADSLSDWDMVGADGQPTVPSERIAEKHRSTTLAGMKAGRLRDRLAAGLAVLMSRKAASRMMRRPEGKVVDAMLMANIRRARDQSAVASTEIARLKELQSKLLQEMRTAVHNARITTERNSYRLQSQLRGATRLLQQMQQKRAQHTAEELRMISAIANTKAKILQLKVVVRKKLRSPRKGGIKGLVDAVKAGMLPSPTGRSDELLLAAQVDAAAQTDASDCLAEILRAQTNIERREKRVRRAISRLQVAMQQLSKCDCSLEAEVTCAHCTCVLLQPRMLYPCGHSFCAECLTSMRVGHSIELWQCSQCKQQCDGHIPNHAAAQIAAKWAVKESGSHDLALAIASFARELADNSAKRRSTRGEVLNAATQLR